MTIRRLLIALVGLVTLAVAAHGVYWWVVADVLHIGISTWVEDRRAAGWTISHAAPVIDGYPMRVRAIIDDPDIVIPSAVSGASNGWRWRGNRIGLEVQPWNLRKYSFSIVGRHRVYVSRGEHQKNFGVTLGSLSGQARIASDGRMEFVGLEVGTIEAGRPGVSEFLRVSQLGLTLYMPEYLGEGVVKPAGHEPTGHVVSASAENIVLSKKARYPFGRTVRRIAIKAKLIGNLVLAPTLAQTLMAWRDAGGTLELQRIDVDWGKFVLSGEGTVALDGELQPIVAMTARINGYRETVDALVETGFIRERDALTTKLVLGLVARATPGGKSQLTIPLTIQNRVLLAGPARIIKVPTIDWETGSVILN